MKFPATLIVSFTAATALLNTSANAASCDTLKVAKLFLYSDVIKCTASTGLVPGTTPSTEVLARVCGDSDCTAAIASIKALDLGDCTISGVALESQFLTPIQEYCGSSTASSSGASSAVITTSGAPMVAAGVTTATIALVAAVAGANFV